MKSSSTLTSFLNWQAACLLELLRWSQVFFTGRGLAERINDSYMAVSWDLRNYGHNEESLEKSFFAMEAKQ